MIDGVARETLGEYVERLLLWSERMNLIGDSTKENIWQRHVEDSLQISNLLESNKSVLDIGTGAGVPGFILSILRKDLFFSLLDSNSKKCMFLKSLKDLSKNYEVLNLRIENLNPETKFDIILSRAFAGLANIFKMSYPHINENGKLILHKGKNFKSEIEEAKKFWSFDLKIHESIVERDSVILEIGSLWKIK